MFPFLPFAKKKESEEASVDEDFHAHREEIAAGRKSRKSSKAAKDGQEDLLLNEKKRARRRLVGAVALVLGLVITLPMIFDSEPKSQLDDIDIRIPSKEKVLPPSRPAPVEMSVKKQDVAPAKKQDAAPEKFVAAKQTKKQADVKAPTKQAEGKLLIQVVALTDQKKINEIRARLKGAGINSYTEKVSKKKGAPVRVRIGPFAKKSDAEATCAKLMMMELSCTIMPIK